MFKNGLNSSTDITQINSIMQKNVHLQKFTNCRTPDSCLSTGSSSIYSSLLGRSSSTFMLPEKLQIVKPLEGSNTLQHWQKLGTPNLGCLFEKRPGISIKGNNSPDETSKHLAMQEKKERHSNKNYYQDEDDGVNLDMYDEDDEDELDFNFSNNNNNNDFDSSDPSNLFNEKFSLNTSFTDSEDSDQKKTHRFFSPSKFELLSKLLENDDEPRVDEAEKETKENFFVGFIKNFSTKFNFNLASNATECNETLRKNKRQDCDDPDTPPSSPINLPNSNSILNQNIIFDVFESAKLKCQSTFVAPISSYFKKNAPTPPGTPTNGLELSDEYVSEESSESEDQVSNSSQTQNFFDQIVRKLNLFSFKSVSQQPQIISSQNSIVIKPSPIYSSESENKTKDFFSLNENYEEEEEDKEIVEIGKKLNVTTSTPPPSPSKFSPPLLEYQNESAYYYDEEEMKKSAFVKVTSLNPYLNKSVDLASLLDSLSSLKRNQRLCKYNQPIYNIQNNTNKNSI